MTPPGTDAVVHLIDTGPWIFRAWYALPDTVVDSDGFPANATRGFMDMLLRYVDEQRPRHIAVAFDGPMRSNFRNALLPGYKASRPKTPPDLARQFDDIRELCEGLGLPCYSDPAFEADDLIATLAAQVSQAGHRVRVVSIDKDLCQCVAQNVVLVDDRRGEQDEDDVRTRMGVPPSQVPDLQGLMGDKVDDIPGVDGVGPKTAAALLKHFTDLEDIYARLDEIPGLPLRGAKTLRRRLEEQRDEAFISRKLARLATDAPVDTGLDALSWNQVDGPRLERLLQHLAVGDGVRRRVANLPPR